jgi:4-carboxymuconolactone decarboxylase
MRERMQYKDSTGGDLMTEVALNAPNVSVFDDELAALVRLAAAVTAGDEAQVRLQVAAAVHAVRPEWVEEVILQSYLFAGFPRALNAAREWRKVSGRPAPAHDEGENHHDAAEWALRGERTCEVVYGPFYGRLRHNIRALHPALDAWMIVDGYGKVLSRPQLDLLRREFCIVAACAAARQDRQLHSHLHGALHAGATETDLRLVLDALHGLLETSDLQRYHLLFTRVLAHDVH